MGQVLVPHVKDDLFGALSLSLLHVEASQF